MFNAYKPITLVEIAKLCQKITGVILDDLQHLHEKRVISVAKTTCGVSDASIGLEV